MYLWWSLCTLYLLVCQVELPQAIQVSVAVSLVWWTLSTPFVCWSDVIWWWNSICDGSLYSTEKLLIDTPVDTKAVACISILILPIKTRVLSKVDKKYIQPSFHIAEHSPSNRERVLVKQNAQYTILAICDQSIKCMHSPLTLTISVCIIFRLKVWRGPPPAVL